MYTIGQMASTGPDIEKAYADLFAVAERIADGGGRDGIKFGLGAGQITMETLGPNTLHVNRTFHPASGHKKDIIFDRTHIPASFADAEEIETLALTTARALVLERLVLKCWGQDSNLGSREAPDLQSGAIVRSATPAKTSSKTR